MGSVPGLEKMIRTSRVVLSAMRVSGSVRAPVVAAHQFRALSSATAYEPSNLPLDTEHKSPQEMVTESEWIEVTSNNVRCDGGNEGHPAVYFKLVQPGKPT